MANIEDEFLEVFGGDITLFEKTAEKVNNLLENDEECTHTNVKTLADGTSYCTECAADIQKEKKCLHKNTYEDDNGLHVCRDCSVEIEIFNFDPEWRYYDGGKGDPARCHRSRTSSKGKLGKLFEQKQIDIPNAIKADVELKYVTIVGKSTVRGKTREAIVAACLFYAYTDFGEFRTSDYIRRQFDLTKQSMSKGLSKYYEAFPASRTKHISAEDLVRWILTLTGVSHTHYRKIIQISRYLENTSRTLGRSSPQSVASAVVYFWLCLNPDIKKELGLTKNRFAEKAQLSDITVSKLVREAAQVSKCVINM